MKEEDKATQRVGRDSGNGGWQFRREITLGTVVHLAILAGMVIAGWSNLQKELALIRRELSLFTERSIQIQQHMEELEGQYREREYRLRMVEKAKGKS